MAPDPGSGPGANQGRATSENEKEAKRTVACSLDPLIPSEEHKAAIRDAVHRVHKATILATELLNLHVRRLAYRRAVFGPSALNIYANHGVVTAPRSPCFTQSATLASE